MKTDPAVKDLKKEGKAENRAGWLQESAGQATKWAGALTGNNAKKEQGKQKQLVGNAMKHEGKAIEHVADAEKEMDKAATPKA